MKVFDCFTFFNELELLELRLQLLDKYVDHFVIAESNLTHAGQEKPYYFEQHRERFRPWLQKIIYLPIQQTTKGLVFTPTDHYEPSGAAWQLENEQRNALLQAAGQMQDEDLVLLSDLDEIPSPPSIRTMNIDRGPVAFSLLFHYYFLNCQLTGECRWWKGCIAARASDFRSITPQGLRDKRDVWPSIPRAGWHFSFMGGPERIRFKLLSYAHTEYNREQYTDAERISHSIAAGEDILKREGYRFGYFPLSYYPAELQRVMRKFPELLHPVPRNPAKDLYYWIRRLTKGYA